MRCVQLILHFFIISCCFGQDKGLDYVIDFITVKQGLSHNYVTSIVSDDLNMKWIGTENGITKFNGYDFEYIKPSSRYQGLLNENIEVLFKDANSNIWIGTKSGGLSFLDIQKNQIQTYNHLIDFRKKGDLRVTAIAQDDLNQIWIGTWKSGVFVIDIDTNKLIKQYNHNEPISSIEKDFNHNVWFCSGTKVYRYNHTKNKIIEFEFNEQITDILSDVSRNKVWISTSGKHDKLYDFDYYTNSIEHIKTNVYSNFSKKLSLDANNRLWIGTWGRGVYRSNENLSDFYKLDLVSENSDKISGNYNTILNIHHDKNNVTWLTTASGGVVKLLEGNGFRNIANITKNEDLKESLNCVSIHKSDDLLFVGTLYSGLYFGNNYKDLKPLKGIPKEKINTLHEFNSKLYIGTAEGLYIYDLKKQQIVFETKIIKKVTAFLIEKNEIFIGTQQDGIIVVDLEFIGDPSKYKVYAEDFQENNKIESNRITTIKKDAYNTIWIATYNGLHLYNQTNKSFIHQSELLKESLPSVIINSITLHQKNLWLSTPNGLIKLVYDNRQLSIENILNKKSGLNSDFICASNFDANGNLWFSTHTEIVKYNDSTKNLTSYGDINGVKSTLFNNNSSFNYRNERLYFGGIDNITFFEPSKIKDFNTIPEVVFTNLRVKNELIQYDENSPIISKDFNYVDKINLTHNDDFFSTSFVANDFLGKLNISYRYMLEGYQKDWIDLRNTNEINFAGLSPGSYNLKVEASRDYKNWSKPKSIEIVLTGSPWKSPLAITLYTMAFLLIVSYFVWLNNYKLKLKNKLEISRIDKEKKIELAESKLNFFTNISHEFRTPLTLIISPLKELLDYKDLPPKIYKSLTYIDKNTSRLLTLINQLLDFRKAEFGTLKLNVSDGNFVRFSKEVYLYFKEASKAKQINYKFVSSQDVITFPFDRMKMEIVLCNLLSNALKFTERGGHIEMNISTENEHCIISVKDDGIGMKTKDLDKIFNRFFQIETANTVQMVGSGIGLSFSKKIVELHHGDITVKSKPKKGTEFIVKLATSSSVYKGEINESFKKTDDIKAYDTSKVETPSENLGIGHKKVSVLIIDDNPEILNYLNDILSQDYEILQAENGQEGIDKAMDKIPDLIVSDVMMPVKDGIALCKELKTNINTSHIPIILLTARTSTVFEIDGLENGADDYITKPFNAQVVKARITSLLENREKIKAHFLNKVRFEPTNQDIQNSVDKENSFIEKAILMVEDNLQNEKFDIESMLEEFNMSRSSLFRKIKSLTGLSLSAFIRSVRIKKAAHLILTEDMSLKEIAFNVGFNTYKYFKISFEKQFDCLPSKYKELHENTSSDQN